MKVTVWMSAYNHGKYISQCLDSVLNQKTDFEFDIVLGEDCSTDDTREIAKQYASKYPGKIYLYLPEKNIGMMPMDVATMKMCKGEYLALMNGDDYWTDENKLQTQADFLDTHKEAILCFHQARVENETDGSTFDTVFLEKENFLPVESLLQGYNPIMTATVMMRNKFNIPDWYAELPYGDMPMYLLLCEQGKIMYIDKLMSVYRIHSNGDWQGDSVKNNLLKDLKFYKTINEKLDGRYEHLIRKIFARRYFDLARLTIKNKNFDEAREYFTMIDKSDTEFKKNNSEDVESLKEILYNNRDENEFPGLLSAEVKWKTN